MLQFLETSLIFISLLIALIFYIYYLTVKIDIVEEAYYLKQVFHLLFFLFHLAVKVDLVEVVY